MHIFNSYQEKAKFLNDILLISIWEKIIRLTISFADRVVRILSCIADKNVNYDLVLKKN
jgi:hypothetical protein